MCVCASLPVVLNKVPSRIKQRQPTDRSYRTSVFVEEKEKEVERLNETLLFSRFTYRDLLDLSFGKLLFGSKAGDGLRTNLIKTLECLCGVGSMGRGNFFFTGKQDDTSKI